MHSPFTFNPNAHRASSSYQQQSGAAIYNIGAPPAKQGFVSHPNFVMSRSYASVVSLPQTMNNANPGIIESFFNQFQHNQPQAPKVKQFDDFSHMPPRQQGQQVQHFFPIPLIPNTNMYPTPQSAKVHHRGPTSVGHFMSQFWNGCHQQQQQQNQPQRHKGRPGWWFRSKGFRCGYGSQRNNNKGNGKLHDHDVSAQKHVHEKERSNLGRDIRDDYCDFVDVTKDEDLMDHVREQNKLKETAKATSANPPFEISSFEDFPAIPGKKSEPVAQRSTPTPPPPANPAKSEEDFVVFPAEASISTPSVSPPRVTLCDKIMMSPQKLLRPLPKLSCFKPLLPIANLKPCLKPARRTISECSDDFIVFANDSKEDECEDAMEWSDSESEDEDDDDDGAETEDDEDEVDGGSEISDCSDESDEEDGDLPTPEHQIDSGIEERKVRFNMTPKVHVMHVWNYAYRAYRKGDPWSQAARDHMRFQKTIRDLAAVINPVLQRNHRDKIYHERFETETETMME